MSDRDNIYTLFIELRYNDCAIWVENNMLSLNAPDGFENEQVFRFIREHKEQIIGILSENGIFSEEKFLETEILKNVFAGNYPLSHAQERLWFIEQYEQGTNAYHIPAVYELNSSTNIEGIKYALCRIVERHEVLRSTIVQESDQQHATQLVHDEPLTIEEVSLAGTSVLKELIKTDINRPFDLSMEYPVRAKFYKIDNAGQQRVLLLVNVHHIASDGWSINIFKGELYAYYEAYIAGDLQYSLPAPEIQYKDYAVWQKIYLSGGVLADQLNYWKQKLAGYQPLELLADRARPSKTDYSGAYQVFTLSKDISDKLRGIARQYGTTLHTVLLSSVNILLSKYTGQEDIVTGSPIANRHHRQTQGLIGFFVNTLANRTMLGMEQSFEELVQQVHEEQVQAQLHQDLPFEKLVDELGVERDPLKHPLFQVLFSVQGFDNQDNALDLQKNYLLSFDATDIYNIERFDLSIYIDDSTPGFRGQISYTTSLFDAETITRFIGHYTRLLERLTEAPGRPYSQLNIVSPAEYEQVVCEWNNETIDYPNDKTIDQLFCEQAKKTPDNIALVYDGQQLTYLELDEKTNQLARYIRKQYEHKTKQPLAADTLIALYLDRGLEMVVAILAVLKAGGAYVPIDTAYPQERIDYLLEDSSAALVLCQKRISNENGIELPADKIIYTDLTDSLYIEEDKTALAAYSDASNLAYIIYTSGTTGKPKGVMQVHANVMRLFTCTEHQFGFHGADVWTLFHSYVFDFSVWELWGALLYGGKLVIPSREQTKDVERFLDLCKANKVTVLNQTPAAFYNFADVASRAGQPLPSLRYIIFGGEALNMAQLQTWWAYQSHHNLSTRLINMYGITETTVHVTYKELVNGKTQQSDIGRPIADLKAYVLDAYKNPVPVGIAGELYIGGAGLAKGYLNRPALTAERFVANPFATAKDKAKGYDRLYKTGDLVKWLSSGNLEYVGRNDDQVKIRGYRIELGEVEHALTQMSGIKQSCVLAKDRKGVTGGTKYLVGYYVLEQSNSALTPAIIRDRLSTILPEHMVPAALIEVPSFPLTINGKLDKHALPEPELVAPAVSYAPPETEMETAIAKVWQDVLGLEKLGRTDDFFRIGGDSILSIQVSGRIRQLGYDCQVKNIFEFRTVAKLAEYLSQNNSRQSIKTEQGILEGAASLLPIQQWFIEKIETGIFKKPDHYNQSFLIRVPPLDTDRLNSAIAELMAHHDVLRMRYIKKQPAAVQWEQWYQPSVAIPVLKTIDVSAHTDAELQEELTNWQSGFDLEQGFLIRVGYLHGYADGSARIYFALHHMIVDAVSWRILTEDIKALYEGKALPPKTSSYRQWAAVINDYTHLRGEEAIWWRDQINGMPHNADVQLDIEPTSEIITIDAALTRALLQDASKAYHTNVNDLLLTALAYTLKDVDREDTQYITMEGHGREDIDAAIDTSRTVGWFTTMFPVKLQLHDNLAESVQCIKDTLRRIPNKGVGFGAFAIANKFGFSYKDLPRVSFNYLGQFDAQEQGWQIVVEGSGSSVHPANSDTNLVNINGMVSDGRLLFSVVTRLGAGITKQICDSFSKYLAHVVAHCTEALENHGSSYTPGDFYNVAYEGDLAALPLLHHPAKMHEPFLMTEIQKAYLLGRLASFEIGGVSNHIYHEFRFNTPVDVPRLEWAIDQLVETYPELRTVFDMDTLTQRYIDVSLLNPYKITVDNYKCAYKEEQLAIVRAALSHHVYDAGQYPLFTFHLSRFDDLDVLHLSIDLILLDAESRQKFFTKLTELYQNDHRDIQPAQLHFKDYQGYIGFLKHSEWYAKDKAYWNSKLADIPLRPSLLLKDDPRTISNPTFGMSVKMVEECVWLKFKNQSDKYGISPSAALLSLFGYVLSRYAATKDFLITLTVFNRYSIHPEVNSIWGDFTSTNLFGYKNMPGSVKEKLFLTHKDLWDDLNHGLFNGLEVLRQLQTMHQLDPYQAVSPIIFTGRVGGNNDAPQGNDTGYFLDRSEEKGSRVWMAQTSQAWIDLQALEMDNSFCSGWMYVEQLFDKEFIEQLNADYCTLIEQLSELDWESPMPEARLPEQDRLVIEAANNHTQPEVTQTLVEISLAGMQANPQGIAVIDATGNYTHQQINDCSHNIAAYLHQNKLATPGKLIAILSEKGYQQTIASLGIMQSGTAYLPLHIEWPIGRIAEILEEGQVSTILVSKRAYNNQIKNSQLAKTYTCLIIEDIANEKTTIKESQLPQPKPEDIAYVIFTSGSTGKPKGVTITHKGAVNTIAAVNNTYQINKEDKVLALSELSFDLSVYDLFGTLAAGGTIIYPHQEKTKEPGHWQQLIKEHSITLWNTVPQLMQLLTDHAADTKQTLDTLRLVLLSGDWIPVKLPGQIKKQVPKAKVISLGGATEGSIWSIWHHINEVDPQWRSIPYGQAMPNQQMYVLDQFGEHSPVGVTGEIHIGGAGVAANYWNDPQKTAASFIHHSQLGKLYKTGDLGKWNKAGYMEFEGRKDSQVKLNGYRVELDEIASKLTNIAGIEQAVTTIKDKQLVAYLVPEKDKNPNNKPQVDKASFQLEQRGIRKDLKAIYPLEDLHLDEQQYRRRKSYRQFEQTKISLTRDEIIKLAATSNKKGKKTVTIKKTGVELLKHLLAPLSALQLADKVLPKYLYPSGGSTYAIRSYIDIPEGFDKALPQGSYYYEPVSHYLAKEAESNNIKASTLRLSFKLYKPAIEPVYGDLGIKLAWLELGHILAFAEQQLQEAGIGGKLITIDTITGDYHDLASIEIDLDKNKAVSLFEKEAISIDYLAKENSTTFADNQGHSIDLENQSIFARVSELGQVLESAQGLVTFNGDETAGSLIRSGYHAQILANQLYTQGIGSCTLGYIPYEGVNYSMTIGAVTAQQQKEAESQAKKANPEQYIRQYLETYLPSYMIPEHYVAIDNLPLTANGKVDHKQLPDIEASSRQYVAPVTEMEERLCVVWEEVLELERVGVTDDFFRIGGNSILAIQASHHMSKALGQEIKVADMFRLKTIHKILESYDGNEQEQFNVVKPYYIEYNAALPDLIMVHPANAGSEVYQKLADRLSVRYNCIGIDNYNIHNKTKNGSLNKLAAYYLAAYEADHTYGDTIHLLGWSLGGQIALEMAAILESRGYTNINVILLDTILIDETLRNLRNRVNKEASIAYLVQLKNLMVTGTLEEGYFEKIVAAMDAEKELADAPISNHLKHANVLLFKATQEDIRIDAENYKLTYGHTKMLVANNVDLVADNLRVVNVDSNHLTILGRNDTDVMNYLFRQERKEVLDFDKY